MADSKYAARPDPELIARCIRGEAEAWEALIKRYRRLIYSIPVRFYFSPEDSADVFQAVCVKLIEHLQDLKDESKVSAWLITTTTRQCIHVRARKFREPSAEEDFDDPVDETPDAEKTGILAEQDQGVRDAVAALAERCRRLIELLYFSATEWSYEEISLQMAIPVPSIGPTRARCLEKLRGHLKRNRF